jgi:hypothetical protein
MKAFIMLLIKLKSEIICQSKQAIQINKKKDTKYSKNKALAICANQLDFTLTNSVV